MYVRSTYLYTPFRQPGNYHEQSFFPRERSAPGRQISSSTSSLQEEEEEEEEEEKEEEEEEDEEEEEEEEETNKSNLEKS